jgi:hypothetical protein
MRTMLNLSDEFIMVHGIFLSRSADELRAAGRGISRD